MDWKKKKNEDRSSARHQANTTGRKEKNRKEKMPTDSGLLKWSWSGVVEGPSRIHVPVGGWWMLTDWRQKVLRSDELTLKDKEGWEILIIHYTNGLATKNDAKLCVEVPGGVLRRRRVSARLAAYFLSFKACRSPPVHLVRSELALSGCTGHRTGIIAEQRQIVETSGKCIRRTTGATRMVRVSKNREKSAE